MIAVPPQQGLIVRGELRQFFHDMENYQGERTVFEALVEGPRGSAKSRNTVTFLYRLAHRYAGIRVLVVRKTRASLTESFCDTLENFVIPPEWREAIVGRGEAGHRSHYQFPNDSRFVLAGLDKPTKWQSTNFDVVFLEEASELKWKQVEPFFGALRRFTGKIPWQLMLAATNPEGPRHWLNQRAERGFMRRVRTILKDNPKYYRKDGTTTPEGAAFVKSLSRYTGVAYERHVLGLWRGAEGAVWPNYDEKVHLFKLKNPRNWREELGIVECRISADWGFQDTGVLIVWGVDNCKRLRALAWRYETKQHLNTWAANCVALCKEFQVTRGVGDPSRADAIALFNDMLAKAGHPRIFTKATNTRASLPNGDIAGLDLVRWSLERDDAGIPNLSFNVDGLRNVPDQDLISENKPWLGYDEIPEYTHAKDETGEVKGDRTDANCRDDFCDAVRYEVTDNWRRIPRAPEPAPIEYPPDSVGATKGTAESRFKAKMQRERARGDW